MDYRPGQLIRWIEEWKAFSVSEEGEAHGIDPVWRHAIITSVALDGKTIIAYCYDCRILDWVILDPQYDQFQIISEED